MSRGFGNVGSRRPSTRSRQSWPPWSTVRLDDELRVAVISVEQIKDPAKRAWQAGRMIELHTRLSDIRTEAVLELRARGESWSEIGRLLGVTRARAWQLGQPRNREPQKRSDSQRR